MIRKQTTFLDHSCIRLSLSDFESLSRVEAELIQTTRFLSTFSQGLIAGSNKCMVEEIFLNICIVLDEKMIQAFISACQKARRIETTLRKEINPSTWASCNIEQPSLYVSFFRKYNISPILMLNMFFTTKKTGSFVASEVEVTTFEDGTSKSYFFSK